MKQEFKCKIERSARAINRIVVHCSATLEGVNFRAENIDQWHRARGWCGIGYHYVVDLDGLVELGRSVHWQGAHAGNVYNRGSIGVCYIGGLSQTEKGKPADTRTPAQKESLLWLLTELKKLYPAAEIVGHRDLPGVKKACPCFDAKKEYSKI